jgi:hypothetical protein
LNEITSNLYWESGFANKMSSNKIECATSYRIVERFEVLVCSDPSLLVFINKGSY